MIYSAIFNTDGSLKCTRSNELVYSFEENEIEITEEQYNNRRFLSLIDNEVVLDLAAYKLKKIAEMSALSFTKARLIASDDQWQKGATGFYDREGCVNPKMTKAQADATIEAFRVEFYRLKAAIEAASDVDGVSAAIASENYPTELVS